METKHTPTPWNADIQEPYGSSILNSEGIKIGFCSPMHHKPVLGAKGEKLPHAANAAFIVRACNAHEELLSFVEAIASRQMDAHAGLNFIIECARELSAKARGE